METVLLRTGREVTIRPICASDGPALRAAYERLSERTRYQRFLAAKPRLSAEDVRYLTDVDGGDHYALVVTPTDRVDWILGVGRFVRHSDEPQAAEFAVLVGDPFQNEGIGTELIERLASAARARGIARFTATILADNRPAHRLIHRLAAGGLVPRGEAATRPIERGLGAVREVVVELAA
jgi:RimJ/RimL family protein N-acetyltransferase